ncbi:ketol-acid reductoisomerase [Kribbella sp. NPDC056345]|uniref:ketol-acid reductoisomerase n=1 Tax=Kribbella sp. NPDC056345 TaxID=3345789 RepID=UPI0035DE333E
MLDFETRIFDKETLTIGDRSESIVRGGRHLFDRLPAAFEGVRQLGVIGWGPQGSAQAQNLRDSLGGAVQRVTVGLRTDSRSWQAAIDAGFTPETGTLGEMYDVIRGSDMVVLLISDGAMAESYQDIFAALQPGTTLGLSHGFLLGHLELMGDQFPDDIDVVAVCPKGMGASVRALYLQGKDVNGAGINASFAVHQDVTGQAVERVLGWSIALGAPYTFQTTLRSEYLSDLSGERGILAGGLHGLVESLYRHYGDLGLSDEEAFRHSAESLTGPISRVISQEGMIGVYKRLSADGQRQFAEAYSAAYPLGSELIHEIYDEVSSGNELRSVVLAGRRLARFPMGKIDQATMWQVGERVRAERVAEQIPLDPFTAGVFIGVMMAQIDALIEYGHPYSEIANESVIEAVDSLNPYMHARGIAYLVDNCSITARIGARKWAPRFDYALTQRAYPVIGDVDPALIANFEQHVIHDVLRVCADLRPSVDIFVE